MKILITRPQAQAAEFATALAQAGFTPIFLPVIEIRPMLDYSVLDQALAKLTRYDWVVFTSVNSVEAVFHRPGAANLSLAQAAGTLRVVAIGPKTAQALQTLGVAPDFIPPEYVAEAILPGLGELHGRWVLLPRAEIARPALPQAILAAGGVAHEITVYHTLPALPDRDGLAQLRAGVDWLTFTSPSTVQNFCEIVCQNGLDPLALLGQPKVACIGPITAQAAREAGFTVTVVAEEYTTDGLIRGLIEIEMQQDTQDDLDGLDESIKMQ